MKPLVKHFALLILLSGLQIHYLSAQILIQSNPDLDSLVKRIVGDLSYANPTYQGKDIAKAMFENGESTNLGLDRGIILCTGNPDYIPGPNDDCYVFNNWNEPGHPLLNEIQASNQTSDASVLEFNVVPETDTLSFTYIFGSEEYSNLSILFTNVSDVFGCFISGPNPAGSTYNFENFAILPDIGKITIQLYNINNGWSPCGIIPNGPCVNCEFFQHNVSSMTLQYDGFTVILEASIPVIPCETYHVVLGIADGGQFGNNDSGVFIEASDYKSPRFEISVEPSASDTVFKVVEGCSGADLIFKLPNADFAPVTAYLDYSLSSANPAAYPEGDFEEALPEQITFNEGEDSLAFHLAPISDGIVEGDELLRIIVAYTLTCSMKYDTVDIIISDYFPMQVQHCPDTIICDGDSVNIWAGPTLGSGPYLIEWDNIASGDDTITVSPDQTTWFPFQIIDYCQDTIIDSILVSVVSFPEFNLGPDTSICSGDEIVLDVSQGINTTYLWSTGDTTSSIIIADSGTYSVTVTNLCGEATDEIIIEQWPYPNPDLGLDLELCYGETAFLQASPGFISYTWQDNSTEDFYTVTQSGLYTVTVEDVHSCTGVDSLLAFIGNIVQLEDTIPLCEGSTATIYANSGFDNYLWSNGQSGTDSITVDQGGWYKVNVSYVFGCPSEDSAYVEATPVPLAAITGEDLLCEGDTIFLKAPSGKYEYYWNDEFSGSNQLMVTSGGNYTLKLVNACGEDEYSKFVQLYPLPEVDLGEDMLLFPGESVTLDAGNFQSYIWNNNPNQTGQYYTIAFENIEEQDSIWVEVFDGFCKNSDDIIIEVYTVEVPIVITPNGDGYNDTFKPNKGMSGIDRHNIMVFNRWGEQMWESSNFESGWDGKQNGRLVADGTYFWILEVWYGKENIKKVYKGSLTIFGIEN